jgi:hypothetical protein
MILLSLLVRFAEIILLPCYARFPKNGRKKVWPRCSVKADRRGLSSIGRPDSLHRFGFAS